MFYYFLVFSVLFFSFGVFASVGSVDTSSDQKAAACTYSTEDKTSKVCDRNVNIENLKKNLVDMVDVEGTIGNGDDKNTTGSGVESVD